MARRLALLALLAYFGTAFNTPLRSIDISNSESADPFAFWDEYADSPEATQSPWPIPKVIIRRKVPSTNITMKDRQSDQKSKIIKTTINIESHTNFIVTKRPPRFSTLKNSIIRHPVKKVVINDEDAWVNIEVSTTKTTRKPNITRKANRRRTTRRPTTTTRNPPRSTRRAQTVPTQKVTTKKYKDKSKGTKTPQKKVHCPSKQAGWMSSFLQDNKYKKPSKKQVKSGIFTKIYNWIVDSKSSWFNGGWFHESELKSPTTTTTPIPPSTSTSNWFQMFLDSEENDDTTTTSSATAKKDKKSLKKNYKGYQLLRAYPDQQWKVRSLLDLQEEGEGSGIMWWTLPSLNGSTDILVPPDLLVDVKDHLKSANLEYEIIIWDLQKAISYENPKLSKKQRLELVQLRGHPMTWRRYHRYADMMRYYEYLQHLHSDIVELVPLGLSSEGLPLVAVKISAPSNDTRTKTSNTIGSRKKWKLRTYSKPAIWIDGGLHAREWIAPAVASWMIYNLVEGEKGLGPDYDMLHQADFYIMPVLNPDGYEHSHTHDRLWRKTRSRFSDSDDYYVGWFPWNWGRTECIGVDADRNWDYHWGEKDSSQDPCSDNYAGPHPFSEPETRAVSEFLAEHRGQIKV
ncbi:putative metallocarboxypeptidase ECM14 isoform X2 [Zerene cesonia]|uniref:putative metallocarboxypeptidase ECM14 isoform X2 n=1 Tax=Zerene cesonia TaxID=33412 RepID=UPI0018E53175|nr:putative metallocarboxypeptidase ECM14 isoform X2 [Zerene cesonia]